MNCLKCQGPIDSLGHIFITVVNGLTIYKAGFCSICNNRLGNLLKAVLGG